MERNVLKINWAELPDELECVHTYDVDDDTEPVVPEYPQYIVVKRENINCLPREEKVRTTYKTRIRPIICDNTCVMIPTTITCCILSDTNEKTLLGHVPSSRGGCKSNMFQANIEEEVVQVSSNDLFGIVAIGKLLIRTADDENQ